MLAPAPYQMPAKEDKKKSKRAEGGLRSKRILDATSGETEAPSSEDEDEGEGEGDISSPHRKKRTVSEELEVEAPKRGKISLSDGSSSEADVDKELLSRDKPFAESPACYLPQQSSSSGDLPPEMMESETPPQASSPLRPDDFEVSSRRISPDHPAARGTMKTAPEGDTLTAKGPGEAAPTGTNNEGLELSSL
nr:neurofilament medium polypeptide-like [Aegilops tauschii subsp. strangulata]